jgi:hypothetical protein
VRLTALELANLSSSDGDALSEEESLVLQLAALSHDVLDHKYLKKDDDKAKADLEQEMRLALANSSGLTPKQVDDVCLISDNISLSKELSGLLEEGLLLERSLLRLRTASPTQTSSMRSAHVASGAWRSISCIASWRMDCLWICSRWSFYRRWQMHIYSIAWGISGHQKRRCADKVF